MSQLNDTYITIEPLQLARLLGTPEATARALFWKKGPSVYVLVAGSKEIPESALFASEVLGQQLARSGYGLISGGFPGVDEVVCRAYCLQLQNDHVVPTNRLRHVMPANTTPALWTDKDFYGHGDIDSSGSSDEAMQRSVDQAHAVMLIAGYNDTYEIYRRARYRELPLVALSTTGGAANAVYNELAKFKDDRWRSLAREISRKLDAREVVRTAMQMLPSPLPSNEADRSEMEVESQPDPSSAAQESRSARKTKSKLPKKKSIKKKK
jgi:hypothetical protein